MSFVTSGRFSQSAGPQPCQDERAELSPPPGMSSRGKPEPTSWYRRTAWRFSSLSEYGCAAGQGKTPWHSYRPGVRSPRRLDSHLLADHHLADLHHRTQVGVVRNVAHDLLGVRAETLLEGFDRVGIDVAHADVGGQRAGCTARQALVDGVELAPIAQPRLDQRHVLVTVVLVIESRARSVGIHHDDL